MTFGGKQKRLVVNAIQSGDLKLATEIFLRDKFRSTLAGQRVARQLASALVEHADASISTGNLHQAWHDLTVATEVASPKDLDPISKKKNQLVELTIESADTSLASGKAMHALKAIEELASRRVKDWRAERIAKTANLLIASDESAATGQFAKCLDELEKAKELNPELKFIDARISANQQRQMRLRDLTADLREKTINGDWGAVNASCQKLLEIAPKYKMAIDAQRHCLCQMQRKTFAGMRATHIPSKDDPFFNTESSNQDIKFVEPEPRDESIEQSFLIWVDGVGGYLACAAKRNVIGQALPTANISIPIRGDLRERHARVETIDDRHLFQFLGTDSTGSVEAPLPLRSGQSIELDGGVTLHYTQSHPLSSTARIDFTSRHRTQPWSDAVLLAGQSIILGPNPNNHIFCPNWRDDLMLFRRNDQWFCRYKGPLEIDGQKYESEGPVNFHSTISTEEFSMKLEPAFEVAGQT